FSVANPAGGAYADLQSGVSYSADTGIDILSHIENLRGSGGDDEFHGDSGDNTFFASGGTDDIDGRGGTDTYDASDVTSSLLVNMATGNVFGGATANLTSIEKVVGGSANDVFSGLQDGDAVDGGGGEDIVVFNANRADATITAGTEPGTYTVTIGGETFTVSDAGRLSFNDGDIVVVSQDGSSDYNTIQEGVDAASTGDEIYVLAGTYEESVSVIGKDVSIIGQGDNTIIGPPSGDIPISVTIPGSSKPDKSAIIFVQDGNVDISGIKVDGDGRGDERASGSDDYTGILYYNADGQIDSVTVTGIRQPLDGNGHVSGAQYGVGVYAIVDDSGPHTVELSNSLVEDFQKTGVVFSGSGLTADIHDNDVVGNNGTSTTAQNGIQTSGGVTGSIDDNNVSEIGWFWPGTGTQWVSSSILVFGDEVTVAGNTVDGPTNSPGAGETLSAVAIYVVGDTGGTADHVVTGNMISDIPWGIVSTNSGGTPDFSGNTFTNTEDGVEVYYPDEPLHVTGTDVTDYIFGGSDADQIDGGGGDDYIDGGAGADAMSGGTGDDTFIVDNVGDTVTENVGEGHDTVESSVDYTLSANVEDLVLQDTILTSDTQDFENFSTGPIADGENGWQVAGSHDQEVVDLGGNMVFRMSSDPSSGDFGGPYSPELAFTAGEPQTTADGDMHVLSFRVKPVSDVADNSRLEVDFGLPDGTDRNNFMVIESIAGQGVRIAVSDPLLDGNWDTGGDLNDFAAFTGNITLADGLPADQWLNVELRMIYHDGPDNDVVEVYVDGLLIGTSTSFENYRDAIGGTHAANAEANQTNTIFFRASAGGAPNDGPNGDNQGFYFDDITNTIGNTNNVDGTGNDLDNMIVGTSGDNVIDGMGGNDHISANAGDDAITGGAGDDDVDGGSGYDTAVYASALDPKADISFNTATGKWVVAASDGTDSLVNVEAIDDGSGHQILLVGGGGYTSLTDALADAGDGDTIIIAGGMTLNEGVVQVNHAVTILGQNVGVTGYDAGRDTAHESVLDGALQINVAGVDVDGIKILGGATVLGEPASVYVGADNVTIENTVIEGDGTASRAFLTPYGGGVIGLLIDGNLVTGWASSGGYFNPTTGFTVTNNHFENDGNAFNGDNWDVSTFIDGNTFTNNSSVDVAYGVLEPNVDVSAFFGTNTYDTGKGGVSIYLYGSTTGQQEVTGTDFADHFIPTYISNPSNLTLNGGGGDDNIEGGALDDVINGGVGSDTIDGAGGTDTVVLDGSFADYTIAGSGGTYTVVMGVDTDVLTHIEKININGVTVDADDARTNIGVTIDSIDDPQTGSTITVDENSASGTQVAAVSVTNSQAALGDTTTFELRETGGGAYTGPFAIDASGNITVNGALDFETTTSYALNVAAIDAHGNEDVQTFTINVDNVNEAPGAGVLATQTPSIQAGLTEAALGLTAIADEDVGDTVNYTMTTLPDHGTVFLNGTEVTGGQVLSEADLLSLTYSARNRVSNEAMQITVSDGVNNVLLNVQINVTAPVDDVLLGGSQADRLDGGAGNDLIKGRGGNDTLIGGINADDLRGQRGDDTLIAGRGQDMLTGGAGADVFVFSKNQQKNKILDFQDGVDKLDLSGFGFSSKAEAKLAFAELGSTSDDQVQFVHDGTTLIVKGIDLHDVTNGDLII
ncbi:MAG: cadherin domain-containing protein, partial [Hyphomicrobiaceae bacterium]|nr:cadherin domain-containing protein [Hyphomicrobiaceae bacterium]